MNRKVQCLYLDRFSPGKFIISLCSTIYVYLLVSNGNLSLLFPAQVVAIKTDESLTCSHSKNVKNKKPMNLAARPEEMFQEHFNILHSNGNS